MEIQNSSIPQENKALQETGITASVQNPQSCSSDQCFMFKVFRNILDLAQSRAPDLYRRKTSCRAGRGDWSGRKSSGIGFPPEGLVLSFAVKQNPSSS